ncbi:MAG: sulfatase-like hydrolase/transferase [Planctomycetota bacterium]
MFSLFTAWLFLLGAAFPNGATEQPRPNIIVIITDDAGYIDYGFSGEGVVPTPNIDSIAKRGAVFEQGYVTASVCSPSRAGLLSGRYQQRFGHEFNLAPRARERRLGMPPSEVTIAEALRAQGYRTGAVGKWHVGSADGLTPTDQGFDWFAGLLGGSRSYFQDPEPSHAHALRIDGAPIGEPDGLYVTDWIGDRAIDFVRQDDTRPFFLYVSYTAPHTPMHASPEDFGAVRDLEPELRRTYGAMVRALDRSVGQILAELDTSGARDDTLIFFINDNGGATNNGSDNGLYRGMKGSKWEGGIRVPFAASWPGVIPAGTMLSDPVMSFDIYATALAAAGGVSDRTDGANVLPALTIGDTTALDRDLFWRRGVAAAVRRDNWKLIRSEGNPTLLFDLSTDPRERQDVADEHPEVVEDLLRALEAWEVDLAEPGWVEAPKWRRNQIRKHRLEVETREQERKFP